MSGTDDLAGLEARTCPVCGAVTVVTVPGAGIDNTDKHAEWHARIEASLAELAARLDSIPPR